MRQMNVRMDDELLTEIKRRAAEDGTSVNRWVVDVLRAATDPDTASTRVQRLRERLARAGLLADPVPLPPGPPPDPEDVAEALRAASRGKPLSQYLIEMRDEDR